MLSVNLSHFVVFIYLLNIDFFASFVLYDLTLNKEVKTDSAVSFSLSVLLLLFSYRPSVKLREGPITSLHSLWHPHWQVFQVRFMQGNTVSICHGLYLWFFFLSGFEQSSLLCSKATYFWEAVAAEILFWVPTSILLSFWVINSHELNSLFTGYHHFPEFLVQELVHGQSRLLAHGVTSRSQGKSYFSEEQESAPELNWAVIEFPFHTGSWNPKFVLATPKDTVGI